MDEHQLVPKIGKELERPIAIGIVQEVGNDNQQTALRILSDELAGYFKKAGAPRGLQALEVIYSGNKSMPATATHKGIAQIVPKRLNANRVEAYQTHIT